MAFQGIGPVVFSGWLFQEIIFDLRENPVTTRTEEGPKGNMDISYDLTFNLLQGV